MSRVGMSTCPDDFPHECVSLRDWTTTPGARLRSHGPRSAEAWRDEVLLPRARAASARGVQLCVSLDSVAGCATSFLEEAFGGLARALMATEPSLPSLMVECVEDEEAADDAMTFYYGNGVAS